MMRICGSRAGPPGTRAFKKMQKDPDGYLETYDTRPPHRGMAGRTPYEVFKAGIPRKRRARKPAPGKEVKTAA